MEEKLSRYDLGEIQKLHDEQGYRDVDSDYLAEQLKRIGLPARVSRFQVAQKVRELEKNLTF